MPVVMPAISPNDTWLPGEWLIPAHVTGSFMVKNRIDTHAVNPETLAAKLDRFATDERFYANAVTNAWRIRDELSWDILKPVYEKDLAGNMKIIGLWNTDLKSSAPEDAAYITINDQIFNVDKVEKQYAPLGYQVQDERRLAPRLLGAP